MTHAGSSSRSCRVITRGTKAGRPVKAQGKTDGVKSQGMETIQTIWVSWNVVGDPHAGLSMSMEGKCANVGGDQHNCPSFSIFQ